MVEKNGGLTPRTTFCGSCFFVSARHAEIKQLDRKLSRLLHGLLAESLAFRRVQAAHLEVTCSAGLEVKSEVWACLVPFSGYNWMPACLRGSHSTQEGSGWTLLPLASLWHGFSIHPGFTRIDVGLSELVIVVVTSEAKAETMLPVSRRAHTKQSCYNSPVCFGLVRGSAFCKNTCFPTCGNRLMVQGNHPHFWIASRVLAHPPVFRPALLGLEKRRDPFPAFPPPPPQGRARRARASRPRPLGRGAAASRTPRWPRAIRAPGALAPWVSAIPAPSRAREGAGGVCGGGVCGAGGGGIAENRDCMVLAGCSWQRCWSGAT